MAGKTRPVAPATLQRDVGRRVAEERKSRSLTQEQLAVQLGVGAKYIARIERGTENLGLQSLADIANVLGIRQIELLRKPTTKAAKPGRPKKS